MRSTARYLPCTHKEVPLTKKLVQSTLDDLQTTISSEVAQHAEEALQVDNVFHDFLLPDLRATREEFNSPNEQRKA